MFSNKKIDPDSVKIRLPGLKGWAKKGLDPARLSAEIKALLADRDADPSSFKLVKVKADKGSRLFRVFWDLGEGEEEIYIKFFSQGFYLRTMIRRMFSRKGLRRPHHYPIKLVKALFMKSPGEKSWRVAAACKKAGIPAAEHLFLLAAGKRLLREEVLVTRGINPRTAPSLRQYLARNFAPPRSPEQIAKKRELLRELGALLSKVQKSGLMLPDLKLHNLVLAEPEGERPRLVLVDLSEAEAGRPDYPEMVFLERFSPHLLRSPVFTAGDYVRLIRAYLEAGEDTRTWPEICQGIMERAKKRNRDLKP